MTDGRSPHVTHDELDVLVSGGTLGADRAAHVAGCAECAVLAADAVRLHAELAGRRDAAAGRTADCRELDEIVLLLHARDEEQAAVFLTHAATCDSCGPLVEAAMHATDEDDEDDRALMTQLKTAAPDWQRQMAWRFAGAQQGSAARPSRLWMAAALLAVAAAGILAVRTALPLWRGTAARPELRELVAAVGTDRTRPVEGRLTGGFGYAPPPTLQRGPGEQASPRVRIAEAKLEEAARASDTPETQAALGVGLLALGDLDKAIDALEEAVQQKPADARFQSDLSAAYLARAKWSDRAEDWPRALAAAERAIKADPKLEEAYFNRALALEGVHLDQQAAEAWASYLALEKTPRWKDEAAERAQKLKQRSSAEIPRDNQQVREHIEDELLMQWGEAVLAGRDADAKRLLDEAETSAAALVAAGGDTMARDEVVLIRRALSSAKSSALIAFGRGHQIFGEARQEFRKDHVANAAAQMAEASRFLDLAGSPYALWGPVYRGIALRLESAQSALQALRPVTSRPINAGFLALRGRTDWAEAVALGELERLDLELDRITRASDAYRKAGELENFATTRVLTAELRWVLGDWEGAWRGEREALAVTDRMPANIRRTYVWRIAATLALEQAMPEAALHFQDAAVSAINAGAQTNGATTYAQRARIFWRLRDRRHALEDVATAERALADLGDRLVRDRGRADLQILRAEFAASPQDTVGEANAAVEYAERSEPIQRLPAALMLRAKGREQLGAIDEAVADLRRAINTFDARRAKLTTARDRARAYDDERGAVKELVRLSAVVAGDPQSAFEVVERSRRAGSLEKADLASGAAPSADPLSVRTRLPEDTCVVYYVTLPDRVLVWVVTRERITHSSQDMSLGELSMDVDRMLRVIRQGGDVERVTASARSLSSRLVMPALAEAPEKSRVIFVPDGPLFKVPFSLLPDARARPLLETRTIGIASSLAGFVDATERLRGFVAGDVLAIGDGHDTATSILPRLAIANAEAADVRSLYRQGAALVGPEATIARVFAENPSVFHFAGHALVNERVPFLSRLLLAPDDTRGDSGTLFLTDIVTHSYPRLRLVVLATCDGAAGAVSDTEGVVSIARAFFAAGAPSVVASLWPVDEEAHPLIVDFHRQLLADPDPAHALRAAQLAWLSVHGSRSPVRLWGGFIAFGGASIL